MTKWIIGYVKVGPYAGLTMARSAPEWEALAGPSQADIVQAVARGSLKRCVAVGADVWHLICVDIDRTPLPPVG